MKQTILTLAISLLAPLAALHAAGPSAKPNIIFILADDLGWGDLHCYGHPYAKTPNIDRLAAEGTRFQQFYATGVTCCSSRTADDVKKALSASTPETKNKNRKSNQ